MPSTVADYVGRRADMLAFRGTFSVLPGSQQLLTQELVQPGDGGALIAGIEKFAQRVLVVLLTKKGSKQYDDTAGTFFMTDAVQGVWRTTADVEQSFYAARLGMSRQVRAIELDSDPDDERFGSLSLDSVVLNLDTVTLHMTLLSLAGTSYEFLTPITVPLH